MVRTALNSLFLHGSIVTLPSQNNESGRYFIFGGVGPGITHVPFPKIFPLNAILSCLGCTGLIFSSEQVLLEEYLRSSKTPGESERRYRFREVCCVCVSVLLRSGC